MEAIQITPEKIVLRIDENQELANAIRRSVAEVPSLAITSVELFKNDSALFDEMLAHRLGQIPLKTEKNMNAKTEIELKLSKKGPCTVYAEDLQGPAEIVFPKIPITLLGENHKLELVATAKLGTAIEHSRHTVGLCFYRHILEVKSNPEIDKLIQKSKPGLIKPEKKGSKWFCDLDDATIDEINKSDKEAIRDSPELLFVIESFGIMPAKEILAKSVQALEENLDEVEKILK